MLNTLTIINMISDFIFIVISQRSTHYNLTHISPTAALSLENSVDFHNFPFPIDRLVAS